VVALLNHIEDGVSRGINKACTSKPQQWHKPKVKGKLHKPDFAKNFTISSNCATTSDTPGYEVPNRTQFDPRPPHLRSDSELKDFNLDALADITGGNCGVLLYAPRTPATQMDCEILSDVATEENVIMMELPPTIDEARMNTLAAGDCNLERRFIANLHGSLASVKYLEEKTRLQSSSTEWWTYRQGRITASKARECALKVKENGDIKERKSSVIKSIMKPEKFRSKATDWGLTREETAKKAYYEKMKPIHRNFEMKPSGFRLSLEHPFIGASPDANISCSCHGSGLLEVKNPYTHRCSTIPTYASEANSCLTHLDGSIQLKRNHDYFSQIQLQMYVTELDYCDFVVKTLATGDDGIFIQRVFYEFDFTSDLVSKLVTFFTKCLIPIIFDKDESSEDVTLEDGSVDAEGYKTILI
jgi:hypothetical protein